MTINMNMLINFFSPLFILVAAILAISKIKLIAKPYRTPVIVFLLGAILVYFSLVLRMLGFGITNMLYGFFFYLIAAILAIVKINLVKKPFRAPMIFFLIGTILFYSRDAFYTIVYFVS